MGDNSLKWSLIYTVASSAVFFTLVFESPDKVANAEDTNTTELLPTDKPIINSTSDPFESMGSAAQCAIFFILIGFCLVAPVLAMWTMAWEARQLLGVSQKMSPATNKAGEDNSAGDHTAIKTDGSSSSNTSTTGQTPTSPEADTSGCKVEHVGSVNSNLKRTSPSTKSKRAKEGIKSSQVSKGNSSTGAKPDASTKSTSSNPLAVSSTKKASGIKSA